MILSHAMGIDLGTANTVLYVRGQGIVLREKSVVAKLNTGTFAAVGEKAKQMIGRTSKGITAVCPLQKGVIADFATASQMLGYFISHIPKKPGFFSTKPRVVMSVPSGATAVEKKAVEEVALEAGAKSAVTIEAPMAAAIGAGLPVGEASGSMIVDIGAGTTNIAIVSLGGIVTSTALKLGGQDVDEAIRQYIKTNFNLIIGSSTAERLKIAVGSAKRLRDDGRVKVTGRDIYTGLPNFREVAAAEISEATQKWVNDIVAGIKLTLEHAPAELAADIFERGIVLSGGGALLKYLDTVVSDETDLPVSVAENALDCIALGTGKTLDNLAKVTHSSRSKRYRGKI